MVTIENQQLKKPKTPRSKMLAALRSQFDNQFLDSDVDETTSVNPNVILDDIKIVPRHSLGELNDSFESSFTKNYDSTSLTIPHLKTLFSNLFTKYKSSDNVMKLQ